MAPIATADLESPSIKAVADESAVLPSIDADERLKEFWYEHGHPFSDRFANPSLQSLPSLLSYNSKARPNDVGFLCPERPGFRKITWTEFDRTVTTLAGFYSQIFKIQLLAGIETGSQPTVALLGVGHTFAYFATQLALVQLGLRVLLLSPSNADVARDHLLEVCDVVGVVAEEHLLRRITNLARPVTPLLPPDAGHATERVLAFQSDDVWNSHSFIIHSSGTTGMPKPIIHTHRSMMLIARMYRLFPEFYIRNWYLAFPLYHIAGISIALSGLPNGLALTFPPLHWPPAPGSILSAWRELKTIDMPAECLHCAPAVLEDLYEYIQHTPAKDFSPLSGLKILQPGGAALSPSLLKKLVQHGCNVKTTYGSTEIGPPWRTMPHTRQNPHCYRVRNLFPKSRFLEMQSLGNGTYEPVVYKGFPLAAELWPSEDSPNPYRTNDMFVKDPPESGLFVLQGRKDDLLVHSNGEKTNALPLQMALDGCASIQKAAIFGNGRPCTAAIIESASSASGNAESKEAILSAIEHCSRTFPTHSHIDRQMVHILGPGQILPVTPKGSVRRKEAERLYGAELDALYSELEEGTTAEPAVSDAALISDKAYVLQSVQMALRVENIGPSVSFYDLGLDSQKAVKLRAALIKRFSKFPLMFIFEYSSVLALIRKLSSPNAGEIARSATTAKHHRWMQAAVGRHGMEIESWPKLAGAKTIPPDGEVVYMTGATGSLGTALIEAFVSDERVQRVYCAVRGSRSRLSDALQQRGYSASVFDSQKLHIVPYAMADPQLGLDEETYGRLSSEVTVVLHNAWKMDFNTPVNEFDRDCLQGTINLMRFANTAIRKTFAFSSSVATHLGPAAAGAEVAEEELANKLSLALDTGYAQSKFIVERLGQCFARHSELPVKIFRIGQLCGHSKLAAWNETEMFPIMINTGLHHIKAMPVLQGQKVDWLPADICAASLSTILLSTRDPDASLDTIHQQRSQVHNLVNPSVMAWTEFLDVLEQACGSPFERISMGEWVSRLQTLSEKESDVPGTRLLGFFEDMASSDGAQGPSFSTVRSRHMVPELASARPLDAALMKAYLDRWSAGQAMQFSM